MDNEITIIVAKKCLDFNQAEQLLNENEDIYLFNDDGFDILYFKLDQDLLFVVKDIYKVFSSNAYIVYDISQHQQQDNITCKEGEYIIFNKNWISESPKIETVNELYKLFKG